MHILQSLMYSIPYISIICQIIIFRCAYVVTSARSQGTFSHDKLGLKQDEMAARWQNTYREERQVWLEPKVGGKMKTKGLVIL